MWKVCNKCLRGLICSLSLSSSTGNTTLPNNLERKLWGSGINPKWVWEEEGITSARKISNRVTQAGKRVGLWMMGTVPTCSVRRSLLKKQWWVWTLSVRNILERVNRPQTWGWGQYESKIFPFVVFHPNKFMTQ